MEATLWTTFTKSRVNLHATQFNAKLLSHMMVNFSTVVPYAGEKGFFLRYVRSLASLCETVGRNNCVGIMVLFLDELQPFQSP